MLTLRTARLITRTRPFTTSTRIMSGGQDRSHAVGDSSVPAGVQQKAPIGCAIDPRGHR